MKTGTNELIIETLHRHTTDSINAAAQYRAEGRNPLSDFSYVKEKSMELGIDITDEEFIRALGEHASDTLQAYKALGLTEDLDASAMASMLLVGIKIGVEAMTVER